MTIGRVGLDVDLDNPEEWNHSGEEVSLSGQLFNSTVAAAKALRQQLLGHVGTVQPVTWTEDPTADGFYRVTSASVDTVPVSLVSGTFMFSVDLERVPHYQSPGFNLRSNQPERYGSPGGVTHKPWVGLPSTLDLFDVGSDASITWYETRVGPGGTARYLESGSAFDNDTGRGIIDPAYWYSMSPKFQLGGYTVTGVQVPTLANLANFQLDNGLVKFEDTATANKLFKVSFPDTSGTPANWGTAYEIEVGYYDGTTWRPQTDLIGYRVLRNDAQEVGVALILSIEHPTNSVNWECLVTLRLRRGGLFAECHISGGRAQRYGIKVTALAAGAATAHASNEGFYADSADANGNTFTAFSPDDLTDADLVDGWAYLAASGRRCILGIGAGISASAPNRTTDLRDQFMASGSVTINVGA